MGGFWILGSIGAVVAGLMALPVLTSTFRRRPELCSVRLYWTVWWMAAVAPLTEVIAFIMVVAHHDAGWPVVSPLEWWTGNILLRAGWALPLAVIFATLRVSCGVADWRSGKPFAHVAGEFPTNAESVAQQLSPSPYAAVVALVVWLLSFVATSLLDPQIMY